LSQSRRIAWLLTFLLIVAALAGCGSTGTETPPSGEGEPTGGETYLRVSFSWPCHIDPAVGSDYASSTAITNLYDTLVYPTADGDLVPHLAEDWEISDDSLTYTFYLRKGVKFHDGSELTAEDVKFSFDRLQAIGEGYAYIFKDRVDSVEVKDTYTVEFKLSKPFGPLLTTLTRLYVVNKDLVMANKKDGPYGEFGDYGKEFLNVNDAGSGAYTVKEFDVGTFLLMEKFDDYFEFLDPLAPDYFEMIGTTEAVTVKTRMMRRDLEISDQWQTLEAFNALAEIDGVEIAKWPDASMLYLMLNTKNPPLDDIHVRKALAWAFNYDAVVKNIFPGTEHARGPVSSVLPGWNPNVFRYSFDLDKAKAELEKSKYYGELDKYPIEYAWTAEVPDLEKIALMVQADCEKIGLKVDIVKTPWMSMIDRAGSKDTTPHIASIWVAPHYAEAGSVLEAKYHSSNTGSWEQTEWLMDPEIDEMIETAMRTVDIDERMAIYRDIQDKIVELSPSIFAYDNMERHAYQSKYVEWPQIKAPIPVMGYNFDARFIRVDPVKRAELLGS